MGSGGEHVVDHELGAGIVGDVGDSGDINHFQRRVGRRLEKEDLGLRTAFFHRLKIGAVNQRRGDAETWQPFLDHPAAGNRTAL